jgi:hypothetical protein
VVKPSPSNRHSTYCNTGKALELLSFKTIMDESFILSEFDKLVNSGTVIYSDKEEIIEHLDGDLKVCLTPCLNMDTYPQGS